MNKTTLSIERACNPIFSRWLCLGILALAALLLAGCGNKMVAVEVTGYNHMPDDGGWAIAAFSVNGGEDRTFRLGMAAGALTAASCFPRSGIRA